MKEKHQKILELWEKYWKEWEALSPDSEPIPMEPELRAGLIEILTDFAEILKEAEKNPAASRRLQQIWERREAVAKSSRDGTRSQGDGQKQT